MEESLQKPALLSRSILASLFAGLIGTCALQVYNIAYRGVTHYNPSSIINVSSIIFGTLLACLFAGILFYFLVGYVKGGVLVFRIIFLILCVLLANLALHSHYGGNQPPFQGFPGLLFGTAVILAISIGLLIPYFFKHNKLFMD